uniref:Uncharacterized protein n=1 Tax=Arundo donax TaxID=35708 RepID=A0A0A8Y4P3_ARUDO
MFTVVVGSCRPRQRAGTQLVYSMSHVSVCQYTQYSRGTNKLFIRPQILNQPYADTSTDTCYNDQTPWTLVLNWV